jgi:hypothetical protein
MAEDDKNVPLDDPATRPVTVTLPGETDALPQVKPVAPASDGEKRRTSTRADDPNARFRRDEPVDEGIPEHIKARLKRSDWQRHEAQRHLDAALAENRRLKAVAGAAYAVADDAALDHAKSETERAKAALRAAKEDNDIDKEIEAQAALARWAPEVARLETALAGRKKNGNGHDTDPPPRRSEDDDDQAPQLDPKAQAWVDDNRDIMQDPSAAPGAIAINNRLLRDGFDPRTDEFYEELDRRLVAAGIKDGDDPGAGKGNRHDADDADDDPPPERKLAKPSGRRTATPSSRGSMGKQPENRGEVTLSGDDRSHAKAMQMSDERFALGRLRAQGKISADEHARQLRLIMQKRS